MRVYTRQPTIAVPEDLSELKVTRRPSGKISLTECFNPWRDYQALVYQSDTLQSLSARFEYEAHGFYSMQESPDGKETIILADYQNGKLGSLHIGFLNSEGVLIEDDLRSYMKQYEPVWRDFFSEMAEETRPLLDDDFEVRLQQLQFSVLDFHTHSGAFVATLPLGRVARESMVLKTPGGDTVQPPPRSLVGAVSDQLHSAPISDIVRGCLSVVKYAPQID